MIRKSVYGIALLFCAAWIVPTAVAQSCTELQSCGTVGVGTSSPNSQAKMDVAGAIRLFGITYPTTDNGAWFINESGVGLAIQSAGSLRLKTGGNADRVTIDGLGNVGIGTTPTTDAKLSVSGPIRLPGSGYPTTDNSAWVVNESGAGLALQSAGTIRLKTGGVTDRVTIDATGRVGIGTTSPQWPLQVNGRIQTSVMPPNDTTEGIAGLHVASRGPAGGSYMWAFFSSSNYNPSGVSPNGMDLWEYPDSGTFGCCIPRITIKRTSVAAPQTLIIDGAGHVGIGMSPGSGYSLDVNGSIHATQVIGATYQDVAEWVPATSKMSPGTVVIVQRGAKNTVTPSTAAYSTSVAGVVSEKPGVILGESSESKAMIATTGRVKVHVDASGGAIEAGDLLVTSGKRGMAMKSQPVDLGGVKIHRPGTLIGKALESLPSGEGDILVLLSLQ